MALLATFRRRPRSGDMGLAAAVAAALGLEVLTTDQDVPVALALLVALAMTVPLIWRRSAPIAVAAVGLVAWVAQSLAGDWDLEPQSALLAVATMFWALGAFAADARSGWALVGALGLVMAHEPGDFVVMGPLMGGVYAAGRLMRSRTKLVEELEASREAAGRAAAAEERARIARELHDVVAHSLSLMIVQAGAERMAVAAERPETSEALADIERTGRAALEEMRRLLGVLRPSQGAADLAPQPRLAGLPALAAQVTRAGLAVELTVVGEPVGVSAGVEISAYRIVQEALTNALKHAGAEHAQVRIAHTAGAVEIAVSDDGGGGGAAPGGHGLAGMRERVSVYGGDLEVGALPEGGWALRARLPLPVTTA